MFFREMDERDCLLLTFSLHHFVGTILEFVLRFLTLFFYLFNLEFRLLHTYKEGHGLIFYVLTRIIYIEGFLFPCSFEVSEVSNGKHRRFPNQEGASK